MNIFEVLALRSQFENIVSYRGGFKLPSFHSDISSLYYFIEHGEKKNRFRKRFPEAKDIAKKIIEYYEKTNIPS